MARMVFNALALLAALAAALYQFHLKDILVILGHNRVAGFANNKNCRKIPELRACESEFNPAH
jgi:hypothetical protein